MSFDASSPRMYAAVRDAIEHERKVSAAWKALANATGRTLLHRLDGISMDADADAIEAAIATLIGLGVDPEAP